MTDVTSPSLLRRDAAVSLLGLGLLLGWEASGLDQVVSGWFGSAGGFAWRDAWLTSTLLHGGGRLVAWLLLTLMAVDALRPRWLPQRGPSRAERRCWLGVTLVCLVLVPALKRTSSSSCPWDLAPFGGIAAYVPHWRLGVVDGGPGHCFPSGHAVAAFAFFSGYFLWRDYRSNAARRGLAAVCLAGGVFGAVQVVRGAHFVSHVLWSAWICWVLCVLAAAAFRVADMRTPSHAAHPIGTINPLVDEP